MSFRCPRLCPGVPSEGTSDMKIEKREAKSVITKSALPGIDYVCNPYIGCQHGCIYCYAEFMKRFTDHGGDIWGRFLDVKQFPWEKIKPARYDGKSVLLSSVTDPYTQAEKKYGNTRKVLENLVGTQAHVTILTKSQFFTRDIDLYKQFDAINVGVSLNTLDTNIARILEPKAAPPKERLQALKEVSENGIPTWIFVSPIFPEITDWQSIIDAARDITADVHFENLNFRGHNIPRIVRFIKENNPELESLYLDIRKTGGFDYWENVQTEIAVYSRNKGIEAKIDFHHGGFSNPGK